MSRREASFTLAARLVVHGRPDGCDRHAGRRDTSAGYAAAARRRPRRVRGDGIFETLLIRDGGACLVEAHLQRLTQSARLMDLPVPDLPDWRRAIDVAARQWAAATADEGALRLIYSRGRESGSPPTAYVMVNAVPERVAAVRRDGSAAVTLDRGLPATGIDAMPWLLAGAKTLSYAVNMAALRHAARQRRR